MWACVHVSLVNKCQGLGFRFRAPCRLMSLLEILAWGELWCNDWRARYELWSKLLISALITPVIVPHVTLFKDLRLQLILTVGI